MEKQTTRGVARFLWMLWVLPIVALGIALLSIHDHNMTEDWYIWQTLAGIFGDELTGDWLWREGDKLLVWWLYSTLAGLAIFPLLYRLLPGLPDRGYSVARPAGLLLTGYLYWASTSLSFARNDVGTIALAWLVVLTLSAIAWLKWSARPTASQMRAWASDHMPLIVLGELLFVVLFVGWAFIRAHNPEFYSTEKPMEMMFVNGIRHSATFPPKDPWMADYSISYYYFGYVLIAGLADLTHLPTSFAFNLMTALVFALTGAGIMGLLYNLVRSAGIAGHSVRWVQGSRSAAVGTGLLAVVLMLFMGHLSTLFIEMPFRGYDDLVKLPEISDDEGFTFIDQAYFEYWDIKDRSVYPNDDVRLDWDGDGLPDWDSPRQDFDQRWNHWWWFPHSRVVQDRDFQGRLYGEPIVEFPQFSFLLADNHPHVLALPFAVLAISLAVGLALRRDPLKPWEILLYSVFVGGMVFMNAWDAIYLVLIIGAEVLRRVLNAENGHLSGWSDLADIFSLNLRTRLSLYLLLPVYAGLWLVLAVLKPGISANLSPFLAFLFATLLAPFVTLFINWLTTDNDWAGIIRFALFFGVAAYLFYLPWYLSFTSQANGIYPNIIHPTRYQQFFLQFGIFLIIFQGFVLREMWRHVRHINWLVVGAVMIFGLILSFGVAFASTIGIDSQCPVKAGENISIQLLESESQRSACEARQTLFGGLAYEGEDLLKNVWYRRVEALPNQVVLLFIIGIIAGRLFPTRRMITNSDRPKLHPAMAVVLFLLAAGAVLAFVPDILYVRDNFSRRMNTIFKMYYQVWLFFSVSGAYGVYYLLTDSPHRLVNSARERLSMTRRNLMVTRQVLDAAFIIFLVGLGLLYPYFAIRSRYIHEAGRLDVPLTEQNPLTLDGTELTFNVAVSSGDLALANCLAELEPRGSDAIILEAPYDGGYSVADGRISMMTGIPTLMNWGNHQRQWRGESYFNLDNGAGGGQRLIDADSIYQTRRWEDAAPLLKNYGVDYVVVGFRERIRYADYPEGLAKFGELFIPVCTDDQDGAIYRISPS
jgi:uncharacterized membrane protein